MDKYYTQRLVFQRIHVRILNIRVIFFSLLIHCTIFYKNYVLRIYKLLQSVIISFHPEFWNAEVLLKEMEMDKEARKETIKELLKKGDHICSERLNGLFYHHG